MQFQLSVEYQRRIRGVSAACLLVLAQQCIVNAQVTQTVGAGTAFTGTPDRAATFSAITTGTDLTSYSENSLFVTIPKTAFAGFDPTSSSGLGGFTGGFFYPTGGANAFADIRTTDGQQLKALEFNVGSGFPSSTVNVYYRALLGTTVVGSGSFTVIAGNVLGFSSTTGFDRLDIGAAQTLAQAQSADATSSNVLNAIAIDNLKVRLAATGTAAPEPGTLAFLFTGAFPIAGAIARRRRKP